MTFASLLSGLAGWSYVIAWSISPYPPVLLNKKLKSVEGVSLDFLYLNMLGYLTYAFSLSMLYFSHTVRNEYAQRHTLTESGELSYPLYRFNDVIYAYHGLGVASYALYQFYYAGYTRSPAQRLGKATKYLILTSLFGGLALISYAYIQTQKGKAHFQMLDVANITGNIKVCMSMCKYLPQVMWNIKRKSTKGWSIDSVILDLIGAFLSMSQLLLDGHINGNVWEILNNPVKLTLALITLFFDVIFILQHFVVYKDSHEQDIEENIHLD